MSAEKKLKFVVVGCGYAGSRHIDNISQHRQCELVALVDTKKNVFSEFDNLNVPVFLSLGKCFQSGIEADVVVVATPNGTHTALALEALENEKHVLIEKPMALNKADARDVICKAEAMQKKAMVVLQNRFSPVCQWLKQLADTKKLGRIFFVEVNCFWNRDERYYTKESWHGTTDLDGGVLFTQFSHFIDTLYWLFGNIKNISSRFYNFRHQHLTSFEDTGTVNFEFENGGAGCFNFSTAAWERNMESNIVVLAENGTLKIGGQYLDVVEHCHIKDYQLPALPAVSASVNQHEMLQSMIDAIVKNDEVNAIDAMNTIDIIERMYAASRYDQSQKLLAASF